MTGRHNDDVNRYFVLLILILILVFILVILLLFSGGAVHSTSRCDCGGCIGGCGGAVRSDRD